jgi:hypothetical protein
MVLVVAALLLLGRVVLVQAVKVLPEGKAMAQAGHQTYLAEAEAVVAPLEGTVLAPE